MTFVPSDDIRIIHIDPPFLPFWSWSLLIHVGIVTLSSFIHFTDKIEHTNSTIQVTLIEATLPVHKSQTINSKPTKSATKSPPLINNHRLIPPVPPQIIPTSQALKTPVVQTTLTQIATPVKSQARVNPAQRRVLQDHHATDHLNLRNYLKIAQRQTAQRSKVQAEVASNSLTVASAMSLTNIPMEIQRPTTLHSKKAGRDTSRLIVRDPIADIKGKRKPVRPAKAERPPYPQFARVQGWEGTVVLRIKVNQAGTVDSVRIQKSSGFPILDESAFQSVKNWKFEPAKDGEFPIPVTTDLPIRFDLDEQ